MKNSSFHLFVGLILYGAVSFASIINAGETHELSVKADLFFPERQRVAEFNERVPNGLWRADDDQKRLILTEEYVNGRMHGKPVFADSRVPSPAVA